MATPPKKTASAPKAPAKTAAQGKPAAKSQTAVKSQTKTKPAAQATPRKIQAKDGARVSTATPEKATPPAAPAASLPAGASAPARAKSGSAPASQAAASKSADKPAAVKKDGMTAEERERSRKLKATLALLKEDPEWPAFLREQREALLALRDELAPTVHSVTRDHLRSGDSNLSSSSGQHIGDAGSDAEVRALTIRLLDKDREQLFEIDAALERIRRGTYGICEISLDPIPKGRLRVRPFCRLTVKCQEEYEKKYGSYANYRAKNQDSVGFAGLQNDQDDAISLDDGEE